ncbi:hypothetical protein OG216_35375 [Streptomycetaceae bacterium NBC_01309]
MATAPRHFAATGTAAPALHDAPPGDEHAHDAVSLCPVEAIGFTRVHRSGGDGSGRAAP